MWNPFLGGKTVHINKESLALLGAPRMAVLVFEASGILETPNYCQLEAIIPCFEILTVDIPHPELCCKQHFLRLLFLFKDFLEVKPNFLIF